MYLCLTMMSSSMPTRRTGRGGLPPLNVKPNAYAQLGAKNKSDFLADGTEHMRSVFFSFTGKHAAPHWNEIAFAGFLELWGSWLIATAVALAIWFGDGIVPEIKALYIAVVYGVAWYTAMRSGMFDYKLRRHCNVAISVSYLLTGEVGIYGFAYYLVCQTLGTIIAGLTVGALIMGTPGSLTKLPVPLPRTTTSSFTTVVCLELFGAALIAFFMLLNEFINTEGVSDAASGSVVDVDKNESKLRKNYKKAVFRTALLTATLVAICYQFQVYTFSNVAYSGGLFSGWLAGEADLKTLVKMANLHSSDYALSVWDTRNGAAALYILMPWVGGVLATLLFAFAAFIGFKQDKEGSAYRTKEARSYFPERKEAAESQ